MNQYRHQLKLLDDLTRVLQTDISCYSIEHTEDIEDDEQKIILRNLCFSRGMSDYEILINPYGQIRHMDMDTPPDLIQQMNNSTICFTHENGLLHS